MRAEHDKPHNPQHFPVEFDRLIRFRAPGSRAVDWPEGEFVIYDDSGMRAAEPQLDIRGQ